MPHHTFLSLGSNLGDKARNLLQAIEEIGKTVGPVLRQSSFIVTKPVDMTSDNDFLNAAILVETSLTPTDLLCETQDIERRMGRTEKSRDGIHHDRVIDIDILLYDDLSIATPDLTIPHPRMYERDFVLTPLKEIT